MHWIIIFLILSSCVEAQITEVFYNPPGKDNNQEYIEVKLNNLTNFTISDLVSSDNLTLIKYFEGNYSLIVEEGFNHSKINASIYSAGKTIGNGLNNDFDVLILRDDDDIVDVVYYNSKMGNTSLCKENFIFINCKSSPGYESEIDFSVRISEFLPDPLGDDSIGEWIELFNFGNNSLDLEGIALVDNSGKKIFISDVLTNDTKIDPGKYMQINIKNFSGFLNNDGFEKITLEGIDEVSYSGSNEGISWSKVGNEWKKSVPTPGEKNVDKSLQTKIKIERVDNGIEFGEVFYVKFSVLRGNTKKKSVKVYVKGNETVSKITKVNVDNRFVKNEFTLPVQMKNLCAKGTYQLIVEGLNEGDRASIFVNKNNELCLKKATTTSFVKQVPLKSESNLKVVTGEVIYEASNLKIGKSGIYFFCMSLILLLLYLAWEI